MDDLKRRVASYQLAMSFARGLLEKGIITREEYRKIDTIMTKRHGLSSSSIFR